MLYFSTLIGKKIINNKGQILGKISDFIIANKEDEAEIAQISYLLIKNGSEIKYLPTENINNWQNKELTATENFIGKPDEKKYIYLGKIILDKQIVDVHGLRIVRVNDLQFDVINNELFLISLDVSNCGLLRRVGITSQKIEKIFTPHFIAWEDTRLAENQLHLSTVAKELKKMHPADIANYIEKISAHHGSHLLQSLDPATATRVFEEIQPHIKKILVKNLGPKRTANLLHKMSTDELVDLMQMLPAVEAQEIINQLPTSSKQQKIQKILQYDEDTAGGLMTTDYISAQLEMTVEEVKQKIKEISDFHRFIHYVYILDLERKFQGVISLRTLIVSDLKTTMAELIKKDKKLKTVHVHHSLTSVAKLMTKYNLVSVAVLDKENKMMGIITVDDIMRRFVPNA